MFPSTLLTFQYFNPRELKIFLLHPNILFLFTVDNILFQSRLQTKRKRKGGRSRGFRLEIKLLLPPRRGNVTEHAATKLLIFRRS